MKNLLCALVFILAACKNRIDINSIERREHGLSYIKGTNQLVDGEVILKLEDGTLAELHNYKHGQPIGNWYGYKPNGEIGLRGFGVDAARYESKLKHINLRNCYLSIHIVTSAFAYATLYMDNKQLFNEQKILIDLSKEIFKEYGNEYKIADIMLYDDEHEYTVSKTATINNNYSLDTIIGKKKKTVFIK